MLHRFSLLTLAALLAAPACIIDATDDDDSSDSGNDTGTPTTSATNASNATNATGSGSAEGSGDETTAADTTAGGGGACGWGQTGDDMVPEGYICGGDGADPSETFPMACPDDVTLEAGGECGSIQGPGCCDAEGNAWFCGDDGNGPVLAQIAC